MEGSRSLSEIDSKVKQLNATLKESTAQIREMDKALKGVRQDSDTHFEVSHGDGYA
jgi:septal ring factor EnvC (AmiA/AmiB activator)